MLYIDAAALQIGLYFWNRRHNVQPARDRRAPCGLAGMLISALSAPIYVTVAHGACCAAAAGFVVTPKGDSTQPRPAAHLPRPLCWAASFGVDARRLGRAGHHHPGMCAWAVLALVVSLLPPVLWICCRPSLRRDGVAGPATEPDLGTAP